jgi:citrate synthase
LFKLAMALEKIALEDEYFVSRSWARTLTYSGIVQKAIGIPCRCSLRVRAARTVG